MSRKYEPSASWPASDHPLIEQVRLSRADPPFGTAAVVAWALANDVRERLFCALSQGGMRVGACEKDGQDQAAGQVFALRCARNQQPLGAFGGDRCHVPAQPDGPGEPASSPDGPHQHRQVAESFGADPGRYDRARPGYPGALVERIVAASPGCGVLDVGCGTGIAARQFQAAGCRVLGVDPDARMAELARQSGVEVEVAAFEAWDPAGRAFDAVIAGQAWHWVDPAAGAARAAQVLRPAGRLAVFWNAFQPPPGLGEAFAAVYRRVMPGSPNLWAVPILEVYLTMCGKAADGIRQAGAFGGPEQWRFGWDRPYTRDEWLDQVPTFGGHTRLAPAKLKDLLEGIGAAVDAVGGSFTMPYVTVAVTAVRSVTPMTRL